jgi:hypothetical protein
MKVYNYDAKTKVYTYSEQARLDSRATARLGYDVYLIPANATETEPYEVPIGFVNVFVNDRWVMMEDHRGETIYSKVDASSLVVVSLGEAPEGYTFEIPSCEFPKWDGIGWVVDAEKKVAAEAAKQAEEIENMIQSEIRKSTIEKLKKAGKIPKDFE